MKFEELLRFITPGRICFRDFGKKAPLVEQRTSVPFPPRPMVALERNGTDSQRVRRLKKKYIGLYQDKATMLTTDNFT
jgi:putative heme iron utilization protein